MAKTRTQPGAEPIRYYVELGAESKDPINLFRSVNDGHGWWCERLVHGQWQHDDDVYAMVISGQPGVHLVDPATFLSIVRKYNPQVTTLTPPTNPFRNGAEPGQAEGGDSDGGTNPDEPPAPPTAGGAGS